VILIALFFFWLHIIIFSIEITKFMLIAACFKNLLGIARMHIQHIHQSILSYLLFQNFSNPTLTKSSTISKSIDVLGILLLSLHARNKAGSV